MDRRNFLAGIIAAATAPAFIKTAGLLMPIKPVILEPTFAYPAAMDGYAVAQQGKVWVATLELVARPLDGFVHISST